MGLIEIPIDCYPDNYGSWEVDMLRFIRNECRHGFSHDNEFITVAQHEDWWHKNCGSLVAAIYAVALRPAHNVSAVGYGLLRKDERSRWVSSVAVSPAWGGRGIGGEITDRIIRKASKVYAWARLDNPAAMALHRTGDWRETHRDDRLVYYETWDGICNQPIRRARV